MRLDCFLLIIELKYLELKIIIEVSPALPVLSAGLECWRLVPVRKVLQSEKNVM